MKEKRCDKIRRRHVLIKALGIMSLALLMVNTVNAESFVYVTNADRNNVSVIDTATNKVIAKVQVGSNPLGIVATPDGKNVYVANFGSLDFPGNTVSVIDTATNTVTDTVIVGFLPYYGVTVSPNGKNIYVPNMGSGNVSVIDTATNKVTATVDVGYHPVGVAVSPDGKKVYVSNLDSGTVSVIDAATYTVIDTLNIVAPFWINVATNGKEVYVANYLNDTVSVIDTATNKVTTMVVNDGIYPCGVIKVNPKGTEVYFSGIREGINETRWNKTAVYVVDTATNKVTGKVKVGSLFTEMVVSPDGTKMYTTGGKTVSVIDTATNNVTATVDVGDKSFGIAFANFTASNITDQSTKTTSAKKMPAGFNLMIPIIMIVFYIQKRST